MTDPGTQHAADAHPLPGPSGTGKSSAGQGPADDPALLLSAEQLQTATEWVESGHLRVRRRIVSETRTIEVEVRREELVIDARDASARTVGGPYRGTALDGPAVLDRAAPSAGLVVLLREEVPEVVVRRRVYERVNIDVVLVEEAAVWHDTVRHERATVKATPTT